MHAKMHLLFQINVDRNKLLQQISEDEMSLNIYIAAVQIAINSCCTWELGCFFSFNSNFFLYFISSKKFFVIIKVMKFVRLGFKLGFKQRLVLILGLKPETIGIQMFERNIFDLLLNENKKMRLDYKRWKMYSRADIKWHVIVKCWVERNNFHFRQIRCSRFRSKYRTVAKRR